MLLFFRGELMELFLFWLREPPMATDTSERFASGSSSQMLRTSFSPLKVHLCLSSRQLGSEPDGAQLLMTDVLSLFNQPASPHLVLSLLMLYSLNAQEY